MKWTCSTWIATAVVLVGAAAPNLAAAQSTWNLYNGSNAGSGCAQNASGANTFGNTWACTGVGNAGTSATASAWSTQAGSGSTLQTFGSGTYYANAYMKDWGNSGFGAANRTEGLSPSSPQHGVDNIPTGVFDGILLNFGSASAILSKVGIGWGANASNVTATVDITVMRWTGAGSPQGNNSTVTTGSNATLNSTGWSLVGSYKDLSGDSSLPFGDTSAARATGATDTQASSWWLITAFNSTLNGGTSCKKADGTSSTCDEGDDSFKLNWVQTRYAEGIPPASVPEPSSIALAALGLVAAFGMRRRRDGSATS